MTSHEMSQLIFGLIIGVLWILVGMAIYTVATSG